MRIIQFFDLLKYDGLDARDFNDFVSVVMTSDSALELKLKQYLLDIMRVDQDFFFKVLGNEKLSEIKLSNEDLDSSDNAEEIRNINISDIEKYYLHRTLLSTFKQFGYPKSEEPLWLFLSGYFKLIFAYASLGDKNSERAEILCRGLRESFKPEKPQKFIFTKLQEIHIKSHGKLNAVVQQIRNFEKEIFQAIRLGFQIDEQRIVIQHKDRLYEIFQPYKGALNPKDIASRASGERAKKRRVLIKDDISLDEDLLHRQMMFNDENGQYITEDDVSERSPIVITDNYFKPSERTKYSSEQQQLQNKVNYLHAYRNRLGLPSNPRRLPLEALQEVLVTLWQQFMRLLSTGLKERSEEEKEWVAISAILITLTTGRSISDVLDDIWFSSNHRRFLEIEQYSIKAVQELDVRRLSNLKLLNHQLSQTKKISIPLAPILSDLSEAAETRVRDNLKDILKQTAKKCNLPFLLEIQINNALFSIIHHHLKEPFHAKVITGVTASHYSPLTYTSFDIEEVEETYSKAIHLLIDKLADKYKTYFIEALDEGISYEYEQAGSQIALIQPTSSKLFEILRNRVIQFELMDNPHTFQTMTGHFNAYTTWLWHVIMLLTGIRPVKHAPGFLKQINLDYKLLWVSDKAKDTKDPGRLIPICDFLSTAIKNYIAFLRRFTSRFNLLFPSQAFPIERVLNSETTFLQIHTYDGFWPIKPSNISRELRSFWHHEDNWLRHQLRSQLTRRCPEYLLQAMFGHEDWDIQMFEADSCASISELHALTPALDEVAKDLNLQQIDVKLYG